MLNTETMSASSSNKKIKEMPIDRLSALPDFILCYILSFLEMKEASITCLLSKRWQFLWTELPVLRFWGHYVPGTEETRKFVNRVNRTLAICSRHNLESFEVDFKLDCDEFLAFDVNAWIGFAVKNKVKEFVLSLPGRTKRSHKLPQMMYSNPSWTSLTLGICTMAPRGTIQWQSLTTLCMHSVKLNDHALEKIFSGCPRLGSLELMFCSGFNRLEVNSTSLRKLAMTDEGDGGDLKISAPYLHTFRIELGLEYRNLSFENFESLVRAEIKIDDADACDNYEWIRETVELWRKRLEQLFGSIRHVKMLKLGRWSIQTLSYIERNWHLPQSTRASIELHVDCYNNRSITGIALLLESSPNIETLIMHDCVWHPDAFDLDVAPRNDLDRDLFHLKTVCFKNFRPYLDTGEPMLTLARILLKRAIVLEKMVVDFRGLKASTSTTIFNIISHKLLSYPRSSHKAVILFCF